MLTLLMNLWPELTLCATACLLFVLGGVGGVPARRLAPILSVLALLVAGGLQVAQFGSPVDDRSFTNAVGGGVLAQYVKVLTAGAGLLFVLLAWPTKRAGDGTNGALAVGGESCEYFALLLLSLAGLMLSAGSNNLIMLFLGLELASIPTYVMVSLSRPLPIAQEAGVKYFFLGALSAALMLLGFSYLYGATGTIYLEGTGAGEGLAGIYEKLTASTHVAGGVVVLSSLEKLALVLLIVAFGFKMAAFPMHVYVADVYQGAASPLTAMLSFVPKAAGLTALVKVLLAFGAGAYALPRDVVMLMAVLAVATMTAGNVLALLQSNIKRTMAYSSVAHSGYMLAGVTAVLAVGSVPGLDEGVRANLRAVAMGATLFYLAAYVLMNTGVFAVLQQLPAKKRYGEDLSGSQLAGRGLASAETFEDIAGYGRLHPILAFLMAVCCLSLVGIPTTVGFLGKLLLARPLIDSGLMWVLIAMMLNAAVSSAYYLRIPAALFFRALPTVATPGRSVLVSWQGGVVAVICGGCVLAGGLVLPAANHVSALTLETARSAMGLEAFAGVSGGGGDRGPAEFMSPAKADGVAPTEAK